MMVPLAATVKLVDATLFVPDDGPDNVTADAVPVPTRLKAKP
jgi:hypothetical protein